MTSEKFITTTCPSCTKSCDVAASNVGRNGRCDTCQKKFVIAPISVFRGVTNKSLPIGVGLLVLLFAGIWLATVCENKPLIVPQISTKAVLIGPTPIPAATLPPIPPTYQISVSTEIRKDASFPVLRDFKQIDIREYRETYPEVGQGWMPNAADQAEDAKRWGSHLGPLGVRIRSHVPQLQTRPAFAANVPISLRSMTGELALTAAEVVQIAPGSPADGHLLTGDLIIGIEGEMLKSGNQYRPGWDFMHKDARELQLMLGEKIDEAQGRGDIRLTVLRMPQGSAQALPVERKELWSGSGGDQSVGTQEFEIAVPGGGFLTLETHQFDDNIHGDGAIWMDVAIEGDYGVTSLFEIPTEALQAGYGKPILETGKAVEVGGKSYQQTLNLHATGFGKWVLPDGTKRVKGRFAALSYGKVQPKIYHTNSALPLTGIHQQSVVELRFPIGKVGSFSATYPKNCAKTEITAQRHTDWLAAQQREDGSWPRLAGYTGDGWDTAWCGLALMSCGDAKFDMHIRKAAYRIAYQAAPSEWTAERTMRLVFLSEYYLRTKDQGIIAGIQAAYLQLADCCKNDSMAGHKVNGFGYGIAGQHYGTGHLALGMALASRTPISFDKNLVDGVIRHAGEVCVNGTYAYGRGRRMARTEERQFGGGHAMSGPGLLGVQIGGGHESAVKEFIERMDASIGDGDNSHATSSLAYILGSLALAAADEGTFLKHMQNFRYKMSLDDCWEGGFLKSAFPLDFQGGEGVTATWIRSAGNILVLNALKKNLAITGKRDLWSPQRIQEVAVCEWGGQVHSYYLRNWCLAMELLGNRAPMGLRQGILALRKLPRNMQLVHATREIVEKLAPDMVSKIAGDASLPAMQKSYAIELICGLDFRIYTKQEGDRQRVDLQVALPMQQLNWPDSDKSGMFAQSPFPLRSKIEILSKNLAAPIRFETNGLEGFDLDEGLRKLSASQPIKDTTEEGFDGVAKIAFKIGKHTLVYSRPLKFNIEFSHSNHYNLRRLNLKLKIAPRAYFQTQALMIAGIPFDCMYPAERMLEIQGPEAGVAVKSHEGDTVLVDLASENFICPWVHSLKFEKPSQVSLARPRKQEVRVGKMDGNFNDLADFSLETQCKFSGENSMMILEYDFGTAMNLNGLDADFQGSRFMRVWYQDGTDWIPLVWDNYSVATGHHPVFPDTTARLWRVEMNFPGQLDVQTLRFYQNPNTVIVRRPYPQSVNKDFLPLIHPVSLK